MRVNSLRVLAISLLIILLSITIFGYQLLPDIIGLALIFICAVSFTDRANRFSRTAVVAIIMAFFEVIRLFGLAGSDSLIEMFALVYSFLRVLLVITAADGVAQFAQLQGNETIPRSCDAAGHVYALTFISTVVGIWFPDLYGVMVLVHLAATVFALAMFVYFFRAILTPIEDEEDLLLAEAVNGEEEEALEGEAAEALAETLPNEDETASQGLNEGIRSPSEA